MKFTNIKLLILATVLLLLDWSCTQEREYSEDFDIAYPIPAITDFSPKEQLIDAQVVISGQNLEKANRVTVGANQAEAKILSKTNDKVTIQLPRYLTGAGPITVYTAYKNEAISKEAFKPKYPDTKILQWPSEITRGQTFFIKAENGDQITNVEFVGVGNKACEFKNGTKDGMNVFTEGLNLPDKVKLKVTAFGKVVGGESPEITVVNYDPNATYTPKEAIVLWDFEDGTNPVKDIFPGAQVGINLSNTLPKGRGDKFLTIKNDNIGNQWGDQQGALEISNIDINGFTDPHLTFLVNTNGKNGYFQFSVAQDGIESGVHFKPGNSDVQTDDYNFAPTVGWEWRSVSLKKLDYENWGTGRLAFDTKKAIQKISLQFKQGNGGNGGNKVFEINLDQIMITDGPRPKGDRLVQVYNFEDGQAQVGPEGGNAPIIALNGGKDFGPGEGNRYVSVKAQTPASWTWVAKAEKQVNINMSTWKQAYISFWVNTGSANGYMQMACSMNNSEFGFEVFPEFKLVATSGTWKFYQVKLEKTAASRWSGAGEWDTKGTITNFKIGFTTGPSAKDAAYEVNLDNVIVSEWPAW
jgi:hypothetical protein